jgi:hypothetical protein
MNDEQQQIGFRHARDGRTRMLPADPALHQAYEAGYRSGLAKTETNGHTAPPVEAKTVELAEQLEAQRNGLLTDPEAKIVLAIRQWCIDLITRTKPSMNASEQLRNAKNVEAYLMRGTVPAPEKSR